MCYGQYNIISVYSEKNMASQLDKAFCLNSVVRGHHVYKTVWTLFSREIQELPQVFHASGEPLCCYTARHSQ